MSYIKLNNVMPGIVGLLWNKPSTGRRLSKFAHALLKGPSPLSSGERELIASYVSSLNQCNFCCNSHTAAAVYHFKGNDALLQTVKSNPSSPELSPKIRSLLAIAEKVQKSGRDVSSSDIENAKSKGATDEEIHDTVLIAAAFCMFNRYVDGMGTKEPENKDEYKDMGKRMATQGYKFPNFILRKFINWKRVKELAK